MPWRVLSPSRSECCSSRPTNGLRRSRRATGTFAAPCRAPIPHWGSPRMCGPQSLGRLTPHDPALPERSEFGSSANTGPWRPHRPGTGRLACGGRSMSPVSSQSGNTIRFDRRLDGPAALHAHAVIEATPPRIRASPRIHSRARHRVHRVRQGGPRDRAAPWAPRDAAWLLRTARAAASLSRHRHRRPGEVRACPRAGYVEVPLDGLGIHNLYLRLRVSS